jgi:hypothetical protein
VVLLEPFLAFFDGTAEFAVLLPRIISLWTDACYLEPEGSPLVVMSRLNDHMLARWEVEFWECMGLTSTVHNMS